ncbi:EmrB/QacA subfamily drug resistance transporter [Bacillus pakistanensis]|uniref:EmrB/QacA subfamily drug resistance transporter n=1 Tax=Rossellomorea pakistanensis TaxID=992288 RepID=A0ABS2NBA9_9BACI|nr:DHA2 family efflux MFS transporter permease subunit [Bacillus pakistanensis]MBM7585132.1 EmrB/QacA subfamily drug resistance transporter [Bacillus pakistanensis]
MTNEANTSAQSIKKGAILTVMLLGAFVAILNQTLMNVALPEMMNDLEISANTAQWLTTGYMLVNGVLIPVTAFLIERFTTRQLFLTSMGLFAAGTLICAIAPDFSILLLGRVVQAAGAGIIMPLLMIVILTIFPIAKRGQAMGLIGLAMTFAPAIGPTLSGWIVQNYSWRVLFYIVLPIAIIDFFIAAVLLKNVTNQTFPKIDLTGIILSTLGFGGLLYGFSSAGSLGWTSTEVITTLIIGVITLILFIRRQMTVKNPMLEFRVFKYNMFTLTTIINVIITMAMFAGMILVPIYLQNIRGFTPLESGLLLLPGAILMGIMSPITGWIFDKIGARWLSVIGLAITTFTTWEFSELTDHTTYTFLIIIYTARMFGMSMLMMPIMTAGLNQLPQRLNAHGTAMSNTFKQVSGALGTAFLVTVMSNQTEKHVTELAAAEGVTPDAKQEMGYIIKEATIQGINDAFVVATGLSVLALLLAFFIKRVKPAEEDEKREAMKESQRVAINEG